MRNFEKIRKHKNNKFIIMKDLASNEEGTCPFMSGELNKGAGAGTQNRDWWPNELKLNILRQNATKSNPKGDGHRPWF